MKILKDEVSELMDYADYKLPDDVWDDAIGKKVSPGTFVLVPRILSSLEATLEPGLVVSLPNHGGLRVVLRHDRIRELPAQDVVSVDRRDIGEDVVKELTEAAVVVQ